jgi:hypothetical protein
MTVTTTPVRGTGLEVAGGGARVDAVVALQK